VCRAYSGTSQKEKAELSSTPPRPAANPPSLPVQLSVKTDVSPVDKKPPVSSSPEKPASSERRASSDHPESTKRPSSSVATAADQPVAKRPMASSSSDGVSTSNCKPSVGSVSVPHKRAPSFEAEGHSSFVFLLHYCLEGKRENYQVCSVQYCVQQLCTVQCTHI